MSGHPQAKPDEQDLGGMLVAMLCEQRDLYMQLRELAEGQRSLITSNEPERLLAVLGERQRLIDRLEAVSRRLKPHQLNWRQLRPTLPSAQADRIDALVAEVNGLLAEILRSDETDAKLLSARKCETSQSMSEMRTVRQVRAAYAATSNQPTGGGEWS